MVPVRRCGATFRQIEVAGFSPVISLAYERKYLHGRHLRRLWIMAEQAASDCSVWRD